MASITRRTVALGVGAIMSASACRAGLLRHVGSPNFSATTSQFFNRLITLPSPSRQGLYAALIDGLVNDGVWSALDALLILAAADSGTSLINLVSGSFNAGLTTGSGVPAFTVDRGWTGAGALTNVSGNYNPSTAAGNFTQNSASIGCWNLTGTQANYTVLEDAADSAIELWPKYSNNNTLSMLNNTSEQAVANAGDSAGFWMLSRTSSTGYSLYRNGALVTNHTATSVAPPNQNFLFVLGSGPTNIQGAAYFIGGGLTGTQIASLYTRVQTYLHTVGAV